MKTNTYNPKVIKIKRPEEFSFETADCTVVALSSATEMLYSDAHKMMSHFGKRRDTYSTRFPDFVEACIAKSIFTKRSKHCSIIQNSMFNGLTLNKLFQEPTFLKKQWIVRVNRHVFFVDKGVIYDSIASGARKKVTNIFEIVRKEPIESEVVNKYLKK